MPLLPSTIVRGFHREDQRRSDPGWLAAGRAAAIGQQVEVELSFAEPAPARRDDEPATPALFGGQVDAIATEDRLWVRMHATPPGREGDEFEAVLERDATQSNPWRVDALFRVTRQCEDPTSPESRQRGRDGTALRMCVLGSDADRFVAAVAARLGKLAWATAAGEGPIARGQALAHGTDFALPSGGGKTIAVQLYQPNAALRAAWMSVADAVFVIGTPSESDELRLASLDVPIERTAFDAASAVTTLKALTKEALSHRS